MDIITFCLIIMFLIIYYTLESTRDENQSIQMEEADDLMSLLVIILRYGIQLARLFAIVKKSHDLTKMVEDIKFDAQPSQDKLANAEGVDKDKYLE